MNTDTHATLKTSYQSWFLVCHRVLPPSLPSSTSMKPSRQEINHPTSSSSSSSSPTTTVSIDSETGAREDLSSSHVERKERGDPLTKPTKNPKPNKNEDHDLERGEEQSDSFCSDIQEWLQEFRENLVDDRVPERRDSHASSSYELSLEPTPTRSADLGKQSVKTHFPKDRNCEICQRTKITRASCRRRSGTVVPRAEKLVIWQQQITKFSVTIANLETITDTQSLCKT